jgi:hypothetical protein
MSQAEEVLEEHRRDDRRIAPCPRAVKLIREWHNIRSASSGKRITMSTHDQLMTYRPMSQLLKISVVPEIDKRVASGAIAAADLPLQVFQFRLVMAPSGNTVEINDQVDLRAKVKTTRPIAAGESLTLADIDPAECYLEGPIVDGKPAAFFLCQSSFLNFMTMFDFTPKAPQPTAAEEPPRAITCCSRCSPSQSTSSCQWKIGRLALRIIQAFSGTSIVIPMLLATPTSQT